MRGAATSYSRFEVTRRVSRHIRSQGRTEGEVRRKHQGATSPPQPNGVLERIEGLSWVPTKRITGVGNTKGSELKGHFEGVDEVLLSIRDYHIHAKNRIALICSQDRVPLSSNNSSDEKNAYMGIHALTPSYARNATYPSVITVY